MREAGGMVKPDAGNIPLTKFGQRGRQTAKDRPMDPQLDQVRDRLTSDIAALGRAAGTDSRRLVDEVDRIRRTARAAGLYPAVTVAHALECALARGERGAMIQGWLDILRDAVACEPAGPAACDTYLAACSVRYG